MVDSRSRLSPSEAACWPLYSGRPANPNYPISHLFYLTTSSNNPVYIHLCTRESKPLSKRLKPSCRLFHLKTTSSHPSPSQPSVHQESSRVSTALAPDPSAEQACPEALDAKAIRGVLKPGVRSILERANGTSRLEFMGFLGLFWGLRGMPHRLSDAKAIRRGAGASQR